VRGEKYLVDSVKDGEVNRRVWEATLISALQLKCPSRVISGRGPEVSVMSGFGGKADVPYQPLERPEIANFRHPRRLRQIRDAAIRHTRNLHRSNKPSRTRWRLHHSVRKQKADIRRNKSQLLHFSQVVDYFVVLHTEDVISGYEMCSVYPPSSQDPDLQISNLPPGFG